MDFPIRAETEQEDCAAVCVLSRYVVCDEKHSETSENTKPYP